MIENLMGRYREMTEQQNPLPILKRRIQKLPFPERLALKEIFQ
ncbi:hypothetical protein [Desulfurobacterium sp.]